MCSCADTNARIMSTSSKLARKLENVIEMISARKGTLHVNA